MPWLVGMTYKAVRTDRYKYIHWVNRGRDGELDELYDLERDPYEIKNLNRSRAYAPVRERLRRELAAAGGRGGGAVTTRRPRWRRSKLQCIIIFKL